MRLFIAIKQHNRSIQTRRVEIQEKQKTTDSLIAQLRRVLKISSETNIIIRLCVSKKNAQIFQKNSMNQNIKLRIMPGWPLEHYQIGSGNQLEVQILEDLMLQKMLSQGSECTENYEINSPQKILSSPVVFKNSIGSIKQQTSEEEQNEHDISKFVLQKYEELLKYIQKGNSSRFFKQLKNPHKGLDTCENQYYMQELINILHEPGEKGWAAIHYAVYANNFQILQFLLGNNVDINMKTMDDWTPLQIAINQQHLDILKMITVEPSLDPNLSTSHGLPIIMAVQTNNIEIVLCLSDLDLDVSLKDNKGMSVFDFVNEQNKPEMYEIIVKTERRYSLTLDRSETFHSLVSSYRGEMVQVRTPPLRNRAIYFVINPYEMTISVFDSKEKFPDFPRQSFLLRDTTDLCILNKQEKSWYMKGEMVYMGLMNHKKRLLGLGLNFKDTANKWKEAYNKCRDDLKLYCTKIHNFIRNQTAILDRIEMQTPSPKKLIKKESIMKMFTDKFDGSSDSQIIEENPKKQKQMGSGSTNGSEKEEARKEKEKRKNEDETGKSSMNQASNSLHFSDFQILKTLGEGAFGTVFLARDIRNPQKSSKQSLYALKCFKKKKLIINKQIKYTIAELSILKQLCHPYIVNLHFTFQTPNYVYLGLDYCSGKDLAHHLIEEITFSESDCRIYAAQILLALQYLHHKNIIYRDLKPQNIMLDQDGHIKLVDFGLSKQGNDAHFIAKSFCGSPAYLSPQMLMKNGVGKQSDYYCLGAVLYQMLVGEPPFFSENIEELYTNINQGKLVFPKSLKGDARDILIKLLERNPKKRLGSNGIEQIKKHSFFKKIDWASLSKKQIKAPVRPDDEQYDEMGQKELIKIIHKDFDYSGQNYRINRFVNFSFQRQKQQAAE